MSFLPPDHEADDTTAIRPAVRADQPVSADETAVLAPVGPGQPQRRRPAGRRKAVLGVLGGLAGVLVLLYLVGYWVTGDKLPRNAAVAGVPVGGLTASEAENKLVTDLGPRAEAPLELTAAKKKVTVEPAEAGLGVDYVRSVEAAGGGRSFDPRQIVRVLTGGSNTDAVVAVDESKLDAVLKDVAGDVDQKAVDADVVYRDDNFVASKAKDGVRLEQPAAADVVASAYLKADSPIALPVTVTEPEISSDEAAEALRSYAQPAISDPIRIKARDAGTFSLTPAMIGQALSFSAKDGVLSPSLDAKKLREAADSAIAKVELDRPRDATVRLVDGKPKVIPAVNGTTVTAEALAKAVEPVLTKSGSDRAATVELTQAKAKFSTADAEKLGVKQVTGQFTTYFPYAEYRNVNIGRAAELINGTLLKPGQTFSLNGVVGERTAANGFTEGFIISGGKFKRELGGGVSQSATTTYNAMFFAGLKDVEHQPHTLYIDRYPPGREATVAWPNLDLKFTNDTKYGVLVQASVVRATGSSRGSITVKMWSTKTYDKIESTTPAKSNFTSGRDIVDDSASCEPQAPAQGFDVSYARLFYRDGKVVKRENFSWRYGPTDRISCG